MKKIKYIALFLCILLLASCAFLSKTNIEKMRLLHKNVSIWKDFRLKGIIEINYNQFSFRKQINIKKKNSQLSAVVYDSGAFSLLPKPLAKLKIKDDVYFKILQNKERLNFEDFEKKYKINIKDILSLGFIRENSDKIIKNRTLKYKNLEITFNSLYQIERITSEKLEFSFLYRNEKPTEIKLYKKNKLIAAIEVDEFSLETVETVSKCFDNYLYTRMNSGVNLKNTKDDSTDKAAKDHKNNRFTKNIRITPHFSVVVDNVNSSQDNRFNGLYEIN